MTSDLPISPNKRFKYSITFESWDEDSLEMGQTDVRGYIEQDETDTIGDVLYEAGTTYGIYMPFAFGRWESTYPDENADYFEKGIRKFYFLEITNEDGTQISDEESDFITFLLSDGRYELDKFRDYAVGGIVLGSIVLGVGALITYFYFQNKKPSENKVEELSENKVEESSENKAVKSSLKGRAKSVTHNINGFDKKFPIKDAWKKEHKIENKQQKFEVPQGDRQSVKYEMGGDASEHYHEIEYGEGGVARAKDVIMNKIGFNESSADYLVSQSEKFAIWLADSILKKEMKQSYGGTYEDKDNTFGGDLFIKVDNDKIAKKGVIEWQKNQPNWIRSRYAGAIRVILDWLQHPVTEKQDLRNLSLEQALEKANEWHQELQVLGGDIDFIEPETNTIIKKYPKNSDGIEYYWVFIPSNYCDLESSRMGHCGRTGYGNNLISLRSVKAYGKGHTINDSHITIAYGVNDGIFYQVKGKKNNKPAEKYFQYIYDLIQTFITENDISTSSVSDVVFDFGGFGSEYGAEEDYGFEDMTNEELRELYDLKPNVFNDAESILAIYDAGIITDEEIQKEYDVNSYNSIFSSFGNQMKLYERGIILNRPSTIFEVEKGCEDVKDLLSIDRDMRDSIIEDVLCGDMYDYLGGFDYYYENPTDLVDNLNKKNREKVIDEIVRLTGLDKSVVEENGIEYYLNGEDDDFSKDEFDNIIRSLASAQNSADENDYVNHIYKELQSSLEELGVVKSLNSDGVTMTIDLSNLMSDEDISTQMDYYEFHEVSDLFSEEVSRGSIDLPSFSIDSRYSPYGSSEDFNEYVSDSDLEEGYSKGGSLRPKNISSNKKTKIKNMKPSQKKYADGGNLEVSKEDYFIVVKNWVYFTFNYPMGFVKDVFNSEHLESKFSLSYDRYGSMGVLPSFWANLDGTNREILALWIKNNYFNESADKSKLQSISDDDYVFIINHWNMFCFNFPYGFIKQVFVTNTSHYEQKWSRANDRAGSTIGAVNIFFTELDGGNQRLLTDFASDINKFADGGSTDEKSTKKPSRRKRPKTRQPKMVRSYFEEMPMEHYKKGGRLLGANKKSKIEITDSEEGGKIATRTLVKKNQKGETITYELTVGLFKDKKKGYFEIYATDSEDEEYFYAEGGLWIEGGKVTDYDGVYELSEKLRPLMSALNLNTQDVYAEGGMIEHGLMAGDTIIGENGYEEDEVYILDKGKNAHIVNLDKGERFADGGRVTSRSGIIEVFLTSNRQLTVGNLSTHYNEYDNQMLLRNYGTLIATRKGNDVNITNVKYSQTTSRITNEVNSTANQKGMNVSYVDKFADGGDVYENLPILAVRNYDADYFVNESMDLDDNGTIKRYAIEIQSVPSGDVIEYTSASSEKEASEMIKKINTTQKSYAEGGEAGKTNIRKVNEEYYEDAYGNGMALMEEEDGSGGYWFLDTLMEVEGKMRKLKSEAKKDFKSHIAKNYIVVKQFPTEKKSFYAEGGAVDLDYSDILNVLKTKIDDSIDEMPMDYENAYNFKGEEVEHESRDGFIPYTDGGYEAVWFEYLSGMWGAGKTLPTKPLNDEMNRQIDYNLDSAKDSFVDEYPEIVEELGLENIDYNSLYEAGYGEEAETLSSSEMEMMGEDTIMMQVSAFYYSPENSRAVDGKHTIRLFGDVNLESPYHRAGNLDDSYEFEFTFNSIDELETEMAIGIAKILSWFNGDMYNDSDAEMKVRRMEEGGEFDDDDDDDEYAEGGKIDYSLIGKDVIITNSNDENGNYDKIGKIVSVIEPSKSQLSSGYGMINYVINFPMNNEDTAYLREEFEINSKNYAGGGKAGGVKYFYVKGRNEDAPQKLKDTYGEFYTENDLIEYLNKWGNIESVSFNEVVKVYENGNTENVTDYYLNKYAKGGKAEKKYYWIKMDREKIDEYIKYASRMVGMFEGEIYTQAPNKVAFDTEDDMFAFTSMIENHNNDNDFQEGDEGYIYYEELYNGIPRPNIFDRIIGDKYAKGGKTSGQWVIQDWAGNRLFNDKVFDTFEDGWDFIYENIKEETEGDGTYDDYYVVELEYDTTDYDEYAKGGKAGEKSTKKRGAKKRPKTRQPRMVRSYFEEMPMEHYAGGGNPNWKSLGYTFKTEKEAHDFVENMPKEEFDKLGDLTLVFNGKEFILAEITKKKYTKSGKKNTIKDWYIKNYPTDDLGEEINNSTFSDLMTALNDGVNVYSVIGVDDSVVRERLFEHLAEINGLEYNNIYDKWLESDDEYAKGGFVSKAELVWKKLSSAEKMKFLSENFTPQITPKSQETLVGKAYNFLPKEVKMTLASKYANVEEYAEGGEIQDWMEEALASLIEETGNESLDITMVSNSGNEFFAGNDMEEYRVFKSEDDAELTAEDEVREDMEDMPENFNQDFIINYIDGGNFFEDSLDEMNRSYAEDIASESDKKYANRLIAEMVDNGLLDEDDAESDNAEALAEEHIEDFVNLLTEEQMNQGNKGFDYFVDNFGQEETMQMVIKNNLIDIYRASKDAVQTDGISHFLSRYDGETLYLSDGYVAYRNN